MMDNILPFKSSFVILWVTRSLRENHPKIVHYPIFQEVVPDLCRFDKFALPDLGAYFNSLAIYK